MKSAPDPDIGTLFYDLSQLFADLPHPEWVALDRGADQTYIQTAPSSAMSAHQRLGMEAHVSKLRDIIQDLPLVRENNLPTRVMLSSCGRYHPGGGPKIPLEFTISIAGFDITKPASKRWKTAAEMFSRTRQRLQDVRRACEPEAGPTVSWLIQGNKRMDQVLVARSAREAVWTYAALYLRTRAEVDTWQDVPETVRRVSRIHERDSWATLSDR